MALEYDKMLRARAAKLGAQLAEGHEDTRILAPPERNWANGSRVLYSDAPKAQRARKLLLELFLEEEPAHAE